MIDAVSSIEVVVSSDLVDFVYLGVNENEPELTLK